MIAATAEPLADQGLYIIQAPIIDAGIGRTVGITTLLTHSSGEWIRTSITGCPADQKLREGGFRYDAQTIGIGFTYLARYAYRAILNLGAEDDDGNGLVTPPEPKKPLQIVKSAGTTSIVSSLSEPTTALASIDSDGCPISDVDLPPELQLPTAAQTAAFAKQLKALNQDSRLLKQWVETEAGKSWKEIPLSKFEPIIQKLKAAEQEGKLVELITPK
jgi:hypothetical protein